MKDDDDNADRYDDASGDADARQWGCWVEASGA